MSNWIHTVWCGVSLALLVFGNAFLLDFDGSQVRADALQFAQQDADNSGRNTADRSDAALLSMGRGANEVDRGIVAELPRTLMASSLSTNAKNVKIITPGGAVTLRGPVKGVPEKVMIERLAKQMAKVERVDNHLEFESIP